MRSFALLLGLIGFLGYLPGLPTELRLLNLFFLVPFLTPLVRGVRRRRAHSETPPVLVLPLPPAAGGPTVFGLRVITASLLQPLNPFMWPQFFQQMRGDATASRRVVADADAYTQQVRYWLPFAGEWYVMNGGYTEATSHSWSLSGQRFAYDFVRMDSDGRRWRTDGRTLADYLCYDEPVVAAAAGEVMELRDGVRDAPGVGTGWLDIATFVPGNMVVLRHADAEYTAYCHLRPGSIRVHVGQRVSAGELLGACGHSGNSSEPHLHFQFQDCVDFWSAAGLPCRFDGVSVNGGPPQDAVALVRGQRVRPALDQLAEQAVGEQPPT